MIFKDAANRGESGAQLNLALCYYNGVGVGQNELTFQKWIHQSADLGNVEASYVLGLYSENDRKIIEGLGMSSSNKYLSYAADKGHLAAMYLLAQHLFQGKGIRKDHRAAIQHLNYLVNHGCSEAFMLIGRIYAEGDVPRDYSKALECFKSAANNGVQNASEYVAKYTSIAGNYSIANSVYNKGFKFIKGSYPMVNSSEAFDLFKKYASANESGAYLNLALCYYNGVGTSVDLSMFIKCLEKSSSLGNPEAMYLLAICYQEGKGVPESLEKAFGLLSNSANLGHLPSMNALGQLFEYGQGVDEDCEMAFRYYMEASLAGYVEAYSNLGWCYRMGKGVNRDLHLALEWYQKAFDAGKTSVSAHIDQIMTDLEARGS